MYNKKPAGCRTCNCEFSDREEQTQHYKLDYHRYNIKQQLLSRAVVTEEEYSAQCDDLSSLSESESESSDTEPAVSQFIGSTVELTSAVFHGPTIYFTQGGRYSKCYSSLFVNSKEAVTDGLLEKRLSIIKSHAHYYGQVAVLMFGAQHFAGAVFNKEREVVCHKTFHRYTVRAKQGTVQSERDGKGGNAPKSLGSSLRRANQAALYSDVQELVNSWDQHLAMCDVVLFRVAAHNKHAFNTMRDSTLRGNEHKLRTIPFTTYRATLKEVKRVHSVAVKLEESSQTEFNLILENKRAALVSSEEDVIERIEQCQTRSIPNSHLKLKRTEERGPRGAATAVEEELVVVAGPDIGSPLYDLIQCITTVKEEGLRSLLDQPTYLELLNTPLPHLANTTLLHMAVVSTSPVLTKLLLHAGASPVTKDDQGKVPYEHAVEKDQRDEMRRYMAVAPQQWDYKAAKVPSPLTLEMEAGQNKKKQDKKRAQAKAKAARDNAKREGERESARLTEERVVQDTQHLRMKQLTSRERSLLAAEARLAATQGTRGSTSGTCTQCNTGLDGLVPFERCGVKFCSVSCVKDHRTTL